MRHKPKRAPSRAEVIKAMIEARDIHYVWARTQRRRRRAGLRPVPRVGGEGWHYRWVRIYDKAYEMMTR